MLEAVSKPRTARVAGGHLLRWHARLQLLEPGSNVTVIHSGQPADLLLTFMSFRELISARGNALLQLLGPVEDHLDQGSRRHSRLGVNGRDDAQDFPVRRDVVGPRSRWVANLDSRWQFERISEREAWLRHHTDNEELTRCSEEEFLSIGRPQRVGAAQGDIRDLILRARAGKRLARRPAGSRLRRTRRPPIGHPAKNRF